MKGGLPQPIGISWSEADRESAVPWIRSHLSIHAQKKIAGFPNDRGHIRPAFNHHYHEIEHPDSCYLLASGHVPVTIDSRNILRAVGRL